MRPTGFQLVRADRAYVETISIRDAANNFALVACGEVH
jgi:hypothetical protein